MPIYEYRCDACGEQHEKMQRITADPLVTCPDCGEDGLKRLVSQTSFVLKGSGWYVTDYKKAGGQDGAGPSSSQSSSGADTTTSASDGASSSSSADD